MIHKGIDSNKDPIPLRIRATLRHTRLLTSAHLSLVTCTCPQGGNSNRRGEIHNRNINIYKSNSYD